MLIFLTCLTLVLLLLWTDRATASEDPVFPPSVDARAAERLRSELQPILALSNADLLRLIPERSGLYFVGCPNCDGGAQEGQISWTIERPDEVFCKYCDLRYPNNKYPDDAVLRVTNPVGGVHEYPYWEDETGYRYFFRAKGWFLAREYFADAAYDLARLYAATKNRDDARRSALILNRFAQVYPGYCVHHDLPFRQKIIFPGDQGFPYPVADYRAAKWSWWAYMDIPENLIRAYDLIRNSGELDAERRRRIETDLFKASVDFARSYPPALTNMDPTLLRGLIVAGRVLNKPDYIHDTVNWIGRLVEGQFFADGMWREGAVSYHNQTVGGLNRLIDLLDGYTDPGGYVHPEDGEHFEGLDLTQRFPILEKAKRIPRLLRYPNGRVVAVHDTWAREQRDPIQTSEPMLLPAVGHARLGRGRGSDQTQTHLHFSGGYGHQHADLLSLTLFSHGQERLSDIGYTHTRHRFWTIGSLSHNTVIVNGEDQASGREDRPSDGNLLLYVPGDPTFQALEASGDRAYPEITETYRRLLLLIGTSPENAYVVDLFRVTGGTRHEYVLVGDANHDGTLETDLPTAPHGETLLSAGVSVRLPTGESVKGDAEGHNLGYAMIRNVERAVPSASWTTRFTSQAVPKGAVRVHGLSGAGDTLFIGAAPSIRQASEDDTKLDGFTMPVLVHRREGENLSSLFITVLEPYGERPFLNTVERLEMENGQNGGVALKLTWEDCTDYILCGADGDRTLSAGDLVMQGRIGFVRERNGRIERMTLVGGTLLRKGDMRLEDRGVLAGGIRSVLRKAAGNAVDGFVVDTNLPAGDDLAGETVIVTDGAGFTYGYEIAGVATEDGQTVLVLSDDPGFEIAADGTGRQLFFPGRTWSGENRFEIATVSTRTWAVSE